MNLSILGAKKGVSVSDMTFGREFNEALVHQVVVSYMAGRRQGTKAQKTRSEVKGGGRKPYRQKGTGRARAGTIRSPIWRGGGRAFPSTQRNYAQKVNRKMYRLALRSIISELARQDRLKVCDEIELTEPKTKQLANHLFNLNTIGRVLIVTSEHNKNFILAARNLKDVQVREVDDLDPAILVGSETVLFSSNSLRALEKIFQ